MQISSIPSNVWNAFGAENSKTVEKDPPKRRAISEAQDAALYQDAESVLDPRRPSFWPVIVKKTLARWRQRKVARPRSRTCECACGTPVERNAVREDTSWPRRKAG